MNKHSSTTYDALAANRWRSVWLLLLFPIMIVTIVLLAIGSLTVANYGVTEEGIQYGGEIFFTVMPIVIIVSTIWMMIAILAGKNMILAFAGAKPIEKRQDPELFRLVENMAIRTGIATPKIYVINDESLNAFATGYHPKNSAVAFTSGLLKKLEKPELEAVIAHEFGHILHRDTRVMLIAVTMVGIIQLLSEIILRGFFRSSMRSNRRSSDKGGAAVAIILIAATMIWLIGFLGAIFIQLGLSRRREFMADTESAQLTRHPDALIGALKKIAQDARVEVLDGKRTIAAMCIADPLQEETKRNFMDKLGVLFHTHPPVKERIAALSALR